MMTNPAAPIEAATLHQQIMNLPCKVPFPHKGEFDEERAYKLGHRDARQAAAELVLASSPREAAQTSARLTDEQVLALRSQYGWAKETIRAIEAAILASAPPAAAATVPALQVWYGKMPESNGKTNWTAVLHRGDFTEGITLARSEYPDRVRYEADRMRHMIGELPEAPDILAYDADLHSGYEAPAAATVEVPDEREALIALLLSAMEWGRDYWASFSMRGDSQREVAEQFADKHLASLSTPTAQKAEGGEVPADDFKGDTPASHRKTEDLRRRSYEG